MSCKKQEKPTLPEHMGLISVSGGVLDAHIVSFKCVVLFGGVGWVGLGCVVLCFALLGIFFVFVWVLFVFIVFVFVLCLLCLVFLDFLFLIALSIFSNAYSN